MFHQVSNSTGRNYNAHIYSDTVLAPHFHRSYELIYVLSGQMQTQVGSVHYTLSEGQALLVPPHAVHALTGNGDVRCWVGVFSRDRVASALPDALNLCRSPFYLDEDVALFLRQNLFIRQTPSALALTAFLCLAADQCLKHAAPEQNSQDTSLRQSIVSYIEAHFREDMTMQDMASALGYEYHYLSRMFHSLFSMNFRSYLNGFRFEQAYELLQKTDLTTERIAIESGFGSVRNLDRVFRQMSGKSPKSCRGT